MDTKVKKILILSILGLIVLRIFFLFLIPRLPHLEQYRYNSFFSAIHAGDDTDYYQMSEMIYGFNFDKEWRRMLGFPIMIVPFIFIFGNNFFSVFFPLVIFNGFFLFCCAIILVILSSYFIFSAYGGKKIFPAILSGFLFLIFPFIFYIFRSYGPQFKTGAWNDINFLDANWLAAMADQPAAFFILLVLFLFIIAGIKKSGAIFYSLVGFLSGFSAMIRISNVVIIIAGALIIFLYELNKKYKKLIFYSLFAVLGFLPQFIYNFVFFGSPISFGYQREYYTDWVVVGAANGSMWSFGNFFHIISRAIDYSFFAIPVFFIIFVLMLLGFFYIRKINKRNALIVILFFLLPVLFYMFFETGQTAMRYYLSAIPAFIILLVASLIAISNWFKAYFFCQEVN